MPSPLTTVPNVGPAIAAMLERLGVSSVEQLRGAAAGELFDRLCLLDGRRHDPCLLDTFSAAVAWADGGPARPWWEFSHQRKARAAAGGGSDRGGSDRGLEDLEDPFDGVLR